jgi:DNA-binding response OmpR family regulator
MVKNLCFLEARGRRNEQLRRRGFASTKGALVRLLCALLLLTPYFVHAWTSAIPPRSAIRRCSLIEHRCLTSICRATTSSSESEPLDRRRKPSPSELRSTISAKDETQNSPQAASKKTAKDDDEATAAAIIRDRTFLERNQHWIVFVDDEEAIRQSVGDYLYDAGYQVTACADAAAVVEVCQEVPTGAVLPKVPACIVSDIRMPGGPDGLELLQWIRESDMLKRVPVILLTAKGLTEDRIAGYKAGADVYLPKPFYPEELLSAIDSLIQRRQQMTGNAGALVDLQQEMANIKLLLKENGKRTVKQTDVYLTPATREILDLLCKGYTNAEIAEERGTSKNFVTKTLKKIYQETGTTTRTELLKWAIQTGYVNPKL